MMNKVNLTKDQRLFLEEHSICADLFDTYALVGSDVYKLSNSIPTENYKFSVLSYHSLPPQVEEVISKINKRITWSLKSD